MSWADAKFQACVNGVFDPEERPSDLEEEEPANVPRSLGDLPQGIIKLSETMVVKKIGYSVENKPIGDGAKLFTGIVLVPHGSTSGSCFDALENFFGSKNDIVHIPKKEPDGVINAFRDKIQKKYTGASLSRMLGECRQRLLGTEIKWWSLEEVLKLGKVEKESTVTQNSQQEQVLIVKNDIGLTEKKLMSPVVLMGASPETSSSSINEKIDVKADVTKRNTGAANVKEETNARTGSPSGPEIFEKALSDTHEVHIKQKEVEKVNIKQKGSEELCAKEDGLKAKSEELTKAKRALEHNEKEVTKYKEAVLKKDSQIEKLKKDLKELQESIDDECQNAKEVMDGKNKEIAMLSKEIDVGEEQIKELKKNIICLKEKQMGWADEHDNEDTLAELRQDLERKKMELKEITEESEELKKEIEGFKLKVKEKARSLLESQNANKAITDNCAYLQSKLLEQKEEFDKEVEQLKSKQKEQNKVLDRVKAEVGEKADEIINLKQKLEEREIEITKLKQEEPTIDQNAQKMDQMLVMLTALQNQQAGQKPRAIQNQHTVENPRKAQSTFKSLADVQVSRASSDNQSVLMAGHPEIFRNMENISTVKKYILDLINLKTLAIVTKDFEGFEMKSIIKDVTDAANKPLYSEVAQEEGRSKNEASTVILFPGNHYVAKEYFEDNINREPNIVKHKMKTSVDNLINQTIEIASGVNGKEKEIIIVTDPASEETYEYSKKFNSKLSKRLKEWKEESDEGRPNIVVWNMTDEQINAGINHSDKRKAIEVLDESKSVFLDRAALTEDQSRISKRMTIDVFNKFVDHVSTSPASAPVCTKCGIQQVSSYVEKCVDGDLGEYKICQACFKDAHDVKVCWAMDCQSDRECKRQMCVKKRLKHKPTVHDIINKDYQKEVMKSLNQEIIFWEKPRLKRPFFSNKGHFEGPRNKQQRFK